MRHGRSNSVVSRNGRRIYKNLGRMHSVDYHEVSLANFDITSCTFHFVKICVQFKGFKGNLIIWCYHFARMSSKTRWDCSDWTALSRTLVVRRMLMLSQRDSSGMIQWSSSCPASQCQWVRYPWWNFQLNRLNYTKIESKHDPIISPTFFIQQRIPKI